MSKNLSEEIKKDIYRFYGKRRLSFKEKLFLHFLYKELQYIIVFRKARGTNNRILKTYYKFRLKKLRHQTFIQISPETQIGSGFYIGHQGRVIINSKAVIGKNVNVATGVTIGQTNRGKNKGVPTIGDKVWIGTNAVVVGGITIGNDVLIAPNAYVNFDVPDHSIVIGNPGKIHFKENATQDYICHCVE